MNAPSLVELVKYFLMLGATGFGGPVALANTMRVDLVEKRSWLDERDFERGLAVATVCPGPMAYQLGVYCGYTAHGIVGALAIALAFALPPFLMVLAIAAAYERFAGSHLIAGIFAGIGPVVIALILRASFNLAQKTLKRDVAAWSVALLSLAITVIAQQEITWLFLAAGTLGCAIFAPARARLAPEVNVETVLKQRASTLPAIVAFIAPISGLAPALFWFFLKTSFLVFGSGLVVVSFVKTYLVDQYHWLDNHTFVDAVAIGMMTPGPVVITATFVGFAVAGFAGAAAATAGIFLPSILLTVIATPLLVRWGGNPRIAGFVRGVTVAVVGVLAGTTYLIGRSILVDAFTFAIALGAFAVPFFTKRIPDIAYIVCGGLLGVAFRG